MSIEQLKAWLLNKMKRHRFIGGRHTDIKNVRKDFDPKYYSELEDVLKKLIKEDSILVKLTEYGKHVSLNPRLINEIDDFIQKNFTQVIFK
ncbi:MAG: hypothetical protein AABW61_02280 [Candidatus Aenigmatarchaeota archaeon]|mgnify:CR=1 FL=1